MTTPPSRYTEDTLIDAMKHAGRFIDDKDSKTILKEVEGLGTARTRASIIENIKHRDYFTVEKKAIKPTDKCMKLFELLPKDSVITSPSMTALNEQLLMDVENGLISKKDCCDKLDAYLFEFIDTVKGMNLTSEETIKSEKDTKTSFVESHNCPICGKQMKENSKAYYCEDWKGCGFSIWKKSFGRTRQLPQKNVIELLDKGITSQITGFVSMKTKKEYSAKLKVDKDKKAVVLDFGK